MTVGMSTLDMMWVLSIHHDNCHLISLGTQTCVWEHQQLHQTQTSSETYICDFIHFAGGFSVSLNQGKFGVHTSLNELIKQKKIFLDIYKSDVEMYGNVCTVLVNMRQTNIQLFI